MEQVNDFIPAVNRHSERDGYTLCAAELKETAELMGFIGLNYTDWESNFTPAVEVQHNSIRYRLFLELGKLFQRSPEIGKQLYVFDA